VAVEVNAETFEAEVVQSPVPVLVDFWGPQCAPCLALMPRVVELGEKHSRALKVAKVDASKNRRLCANMQVLGLPTFLLYVNGAEVERLSGQTVTIGEIEAAVARLLESSDDPS
jgi:thioredoxin 1